MLFVYLTENQDEVEEEDEGTSSNFLFTYTNLGLGLLHKAGHYGDLNRSRWTLHLPENLIDITNLTDINTLGDNMT